MKPDKSPSFGFGVAACSVTMSADGEIQLTPAGKFRGVDGRPKDAVAWVMDAQAANDVIAFCSARSNDFVIDYEHQTLLASKNGQPAPAAGWFSGAALRWVEGQGLFAKARWTQRGQSFIDNEEYKYISPVVLYEKVTGRIKGIIAAALTNNACIDGMDEVLSRAAANFLLDESTSKENGMDELLEQLRWFFNLPTLATAEEILAEVKKAAEKIKAANSTQVAAANFSIAGLVSSLNDEVAALKSAAPDPARFVSVDVMNELQTEVTTLRNEKTEREVNEVVTAALTAGKLLPPQEQWARALGAKDIAALTQYLETAQPLAALSATQTTLTDRPLSQQTTDTELAVMKALGLNAEQFASGKTNKE